MWDQGKTVKFAKREGRFDLQVAKDIAYKVRKEENTRT